MPFSQSGNVNDIVEVDEKEFDDDYGGECYYCDVSLDAQYDYFCISGFTGVAFRFPRQSEGLLTYSILGGLIAKEKVIRNDKSKLFTKSSIKREEIDIAAIGKAMYEEIRGELEETHKGKVVVIDVLSGDYEIGDNDLATTLRMFERRPNALTWGERIGYPAIYTIRERIFG